MSKQKKYLAQKYGAVDSLARIIPLRGKEEGLGVRGVASFGRGFGSSGKYAPGGYSSRMFPDFTLLGKDWISGLFSAGWATSGMVYRGEVWMLSFSDSPNDANVCLLSDVLESHVHQKYFLSARAATGILRRSEKRGVKLPLALKDALTTAADYRHRLRTPSPVGRVDATTPPQTNTSSPQASMEAEPEQSEPQAPETKRSLLLLKRTPATSSASGSPCHASKITGESKSLGFVGLPRRLTPTECERLQGFPDGWTLLERLQDQNTNERSKKEKGKMGQDRTE